MLGSRFFGPSSMPSPHAELVADTKTLVAKALTQPSFGSLLGRVCHEWIPSHGNRIRTASEYVSGRAKAQIFWGFYESAEIRFVRRLLRSDLDYLELGASLGVVASVALSKLGEGSKAVCVEANPYLIPMLKGTLSRNHPDKRATVVHAAIDYSGVPGVSELLIGKESVSSRLATGGVELTESVRVETTTVLELTASHCLGDFALVCDIEGAESGFVFAEPGELDGCRQMIIELHETSVSGRRLRWEELLRALVERHGFSVDAAYGSVHVLSR